MSRRPVSASWVPVCLLALAGLSIGLPPAPAPSPAHGDGPGTDVPLAAFGETRIGAGDLIGFWFLNRREAYTSSLEALIDERMA